MNKDKIENIRNGQDNAFKQLSSTLFSKEIETANKIISEKETKFFKIKNLCDRLNGRKVKILVEHAITHMIKKTFTAIITINEEYSLVTIHPDHKYVSATNLSEFEPVQSINSNYLEEDFTLPYGLNCIMHIIIL